jgi:hypothetical protein
MRLISLINPLLWDIPFCIQKAVFLAPLGTSHIAPLNFGIGPLKNKPYFTVWILLLQGSHLPLISRFKPTFGLYYDAIRKNEVS